MPSKSFLDKVFTVEDANALIRNEKNPLTFAVFEPGEPLPPGKKVGDRKIIPRGTRVRVSEVKIVNGTVYGLATTDADPPEEIGWTSTQNFAGKFINERIGQSKPKDDDKKGPNAAWEKGRFIGQKTLVMIVDNRLDIEELTLESLPAYEKLCDEAAKNNIRIVLRSGFRTFGEQQRLHTGFILKKPGFATAAEPGFSNHQHGQAFDLDVGGFDGDPVYDWLKRNGPRLGFVRTVNKEPWHWEFRPDDAARLAAAGKFKTANVRD